ncbi:T9SS type A sorting domain-containing protein [Flavobacterium sp.]|uniref:T9SS type A sorting domain-containing protein n=1 Tax=Flavobacterium sp. TaxID=239 RepID=UPI00404739D4
MKQFYNLLTLSIFIIFCVNTMYSQNNLAITNLSSTQNQYSMIPLEQITALATGATIENIGTVESTNVILTVSVMDSSSSVVYNESSSPIAINSGVSTTIVFAGYTPTLLDTYTTTYTLTLDETDDNPSDNETSSILEVTSSTYARDDNTSTGSLGIGNGNSGQLGQEFDVLVMQSIESVTFEIINSDESLNGTTTYVTIWDMVSGIPNTIVAQTETVTISGISQRYTANVSGGAYSLSPGQYLIAIEEGTSNITLATTTDIFTPGTTWVNWPTNPNGWSNNEDFGFNRSYIIRPNFQDSTLSIQENQFGNNIITIYPNPSSEFITISGINKKENYSIYNVLGAKINSGAVSNKEKLNIQNITNGIYFLKFNNGNTIKFLKK